MRSYESSGAVEPLEAERRDTADQKERGAFERAWLGRSVRLELEAGSDVVSEDVQLLPSRVRAVGLARDGGEGEAALQLADDLLLHPATVLEVPESAQVEILVGGDDRILPVAIVRVEEFELLTFDGLVLGALAVDGDVLDAVPWGDVEPGKEALNPCRPIGRCRAD